MAKRNMFSHLLPEAILKKSKDEGISKKWIIFSVVSLLLTAFLTGTWVESQYPLRPLYVEILNTTDKPVLSVRFEHGNFNTQEVIKAVQIHPGETRIIALNHEPELGFNIDVNYSNGKTLSACIGKFSKSWHLRLSILPSDIDVTE